MDPGLACRLSSAGLPLGQARKRVGTLVFVLQQGHPFPSQPPLSILPQSPLPARNTALSKVPLQSLELQEAFLFSLPLLIAVLL